MTEITVEKGVPVPPSGQKKTKYPWRQMEVGDSFWCDKSGSHLMSMAARMLPMKFRTQKENDGTRVWRIE